MSPLWPLFPGTLLLLAAPGGARADSAPAAARSNRSSLTESHELLTPDVDERSCGEDDSSPNIAANTTTGNKNILWDYDGRRSLYPPYGDVITIFCSSNDASNLTIRDDDLHQLQAELLNSTTIQVTLIKPDVGFYEYFCTDSITTCTDTLRVYVHPVMSVTAPHVRQTRDEYGKTYYFVNRNESSYNIYCSAQQTPHITHIYVYYYNHNVIRTIKSVNSVNSTTLMATVSDHTEEDRVYYCEQSRSTIISEIVVIVDYYPEARDFRCVFYTSDSNLECSWKSTSKRNTYTLSILHNQKLTRICFPINTSEFTTSCRRTLHHYPINYCNDDFTISLQIETCNTVFCSNQTFQVNSYSITKLGPVSDLKLVNTSPQGATVAWLQIYYYNKYFSYKVEHRLLGTDWRAVNASMVQCEHRSDIFTYACELQLALPCPDAHYELRVYRRLKEATLDMYWSKPATVFFFTAPSTDGEVDPACDADFREPEPTPSACIVTLHKVRDLISDKRKEKRALKKFISGLNNTLAEIKLLMDATNSPLNKVCE